MTRFACLSAFLLANWFATAVAADAADPDPARYASEIDAFAEWDSKNAVPADPILFVGSSSIRLWATARAFPDAPVVNRAFGGAELSDVIYYYERIIVPYRPGMIVLYAGDNDIANGKSGEQVVDDIREFVDKLRMDFPDTRLIFISIKPSKDRWAVWPEMARVNRIVQEYAAKHDKFVYADLATPLLDSDGYPKDVYIEDGLHLNELGYELWRQALAPYLEPR